MTTHLLRRTGGGRTRTPLCFAWSPQCLCTPGPLFGWWDLVTCGYCDSELPKAFFCRCHSFCGRINHLSPLDISAGPCTCSAETKTSPFRGGWPAAVLWGQSLAGGTPSRFSGLALPKSFLCQDSISRGHPSKFQLWPPYLHRIISCLYDPLYILVF